MRSGLNVNLHHWYKIPSNLRRSSSCFLTDLSLFGQWFWYLRWGSSQSSLLSLSHGISSYLRGKCPILKANNSASNSAYICVKWAFLICRLRLLNQIDAYSDTGEQESSQCIKDRAIGSACEGFTAVWGEQASAWTRPLSRGLAKQEEVPVATHEKKKPFQQVALDSRSNHLPLILTQTPPSKAYEPINQLYLARGLYGHR